MEQNLVDQKQTHVMRPLWAASVLCNGFIPLPSPQLHIRRNIDLMNSLITAGSLASVGVSVGT